MLSIKISLVALLLATVALTQTVNAPPSAEVQALVSNNPQLLTILNNHFGCAQWDGPTCLRCSARFYFNAKGICCQVKPQCKIFNQDVGICEGCYEGYSINNGVCVVGPVTNPGCQTWDGNHNCLQCSVRYSPDASGICIPVSDVCRTWNVLSGICLTCYSGYVLNQGQCIRDPNPFVPSSNSLCRTFEQTTCIVCADRAYFNANGVCVAVSDWCNTWDALTGVCLSCYSGFLLEVGACNLAPQVKPSDLGCNLWDWNNQNCLLCSKNWVFNLNNVCVPVSDQCAANDIRGLCLLCYPGYDLSAGSCIVSPSNTARPSDLGCSSWDWVNNQCLSCSQWHFLNANNQCVPVNDLCSTFDAATGLCTSCFKGFNLDQGSCVPTSLVNPPDAGCKSWEWDTKVCLACSKNWVLISNACVPVSDQCATFNSTTGACLSCYLGYNLDNGRCIIQDLNLVVPADKGCSDWNWQGQTCLTCSSHWYFNANGVCVPVSDLCNGANSAGACSSCFQGYDLVNGVCEFSPSNNAAPTDAGCAKWDWNNQVCLECSKNWVFNANGACVPVSDHCASHDAAGACSSCFQGYDLVNGVCEFSPSNNAAPTDAGCAKWDWNNQVCLECSKNWVFNANGACVPVSDHCASHDAAGACSSCFQGYDLVNGVCEFSPSNNAAPTDAGCAKWDWNNQVCLECSKNWVFNANGACVPVSDHCASHDAAGACSSCFQGYDLVNGVCEFSPSNNAKPSDLGCGKWDWNNQVCLECSKNWVFNANGACVPVSDHCASHDAAGACSSCFQGYDLVNGVCEFSPSNNAKPSDLGCGKWDWNNQVCLECSKNWVFNANGACVPVSDHCASHDAAGACSSCFQGYDLVNGVCEFSPSNNAAPTDAGCAKWDWNNQVCLECSKNWVFNANGACVPVSDHCASHDAAGACSSCFQGYDLVNGVCEFSPSNNAKPSDLGCGKWDWNNQVCLECSKNWVFNANGACVPVSDHCASHDAAGACSSCFQGYDVVNGVCEFSPSNNAAPTDAGCAKWDWNNQVCLECSKNWVFNANGACVPVSDHCASHDAAGACSSCFQGYDLVNGVCEFSPSNNAKPSDLGCGKWDWNNQVCLECSKNWVFNANGACVPVSDHCASHDAAGACSSCFQGYDLVNGVCEFSPSNNAKPSDLGCGKWDWNNQVCLECSKNWVFNANGACVPVSDHCASHDAAGACSSCFQGYDLVNGVCEFSPSNNAKPSDLGCGKWDWNNQVCLECSKNWVFNANGACVPVSDHCASHDAAGACSSCFQGYDLVNGVCEFSPSNNAAPTDAGCAKWDWNNQVCLECSKNWVFNANGACVPVSDHCASHDAAGACSSCFQGYDLVNGVCEFSPSNNAKPSDLGCGKWDWNNQVCLECSKNWVFNANGACVPVSDHCASHDAAGACSSCFQGYDLVNGVCEFSPSNNAAPTDAGCAKWDWNNQVCLECSKNWVFNANGACVPVSDHCASHDAAGACSSCFQGYDLVNGVCEFSPSNNAAPTDAGCAKWNWNDQICLECSKNWVFNANGICVPVSDKCRTHGNNGICTSCYLGYDLINGACEFSAFNNAKPTDLGCGTWDWNNQVCLKCSNRWVFNANGVCTPVSDSCSSYDAAGACTACFQGYLLSNGACQLGNPLCKTSTPTGACATCYTGYVILNGTCTPISKLASIYLYYAECCPEKLAALQAAAVAQP